jgi:plastocyanin
MNGRRLGILVVVLALVGISLVGAGVVLASNAGGTAGWFEGMMGGSAQGNGSTQGNGYVYRPGTMGGGYGPGMMGGGYGTSGTGETSPGPGEAGFVAGTPGAPRVVHILALPSLRFSPATVRVQAGETIEFQVTTVGPTVHEFMVGPAAAVAADEEGTPEIADIAMMETRSLTYTFDGSGPYAFACHAPGHYEAGMTGTIVIVG